MSDIHTCIHTCIICDQPATTWRLFAPYATYSARVGHLCAEHIAISREAFHAACIALSRNADIAAYEERNRKAIEDERRDAGRLSAKRRAAISKRWTQLKANKPADMPRFVSEKPVEASESQNTTQDTYELTEAR